MTDELICPFCNKPLQPTYYSVDEYWCENDDCTGSSWKFGSTSLWRELIRARKALDVALDKLKRIQKIYTNAPFNAPINYANVCTDMYDVATE